MTFGEGLHAAGFVLTGVCWISLTIRAFRLDRRWGWACLLLPVPMPGVFAGRFLKDRRIIPLFSLYVVAVLLMLLAMIAGDTGVAGQPIQSIWAKVLILMSVVSFIQWKPMGLFPPKGRLADA